MTQPFTPRLYQTTITNYILDHSRCAIWASMGLGKSAATLQALDLISVVEEGPTLIIAPLRVARNVWSDEIEKWNCFKRLTISKILGSPEERSRALTKKADIYTVNFENLPWLVERLGKNWPFTKIVVDEATKLKGFRSRQGTARARALSKVAFLNVKHFIELTGTPAPNGVVDLWGQSWFLDQGERLGKTFTAFSNRWFRPDWSGYGLVPLPHAQKEIEGKLADVCLSLKAEDYFDLKEPIVNTISVPLPPAAMKKYKAMEKDMFVQLAKHEVEALNAASMTVKCLQIANGALYVEGSNEKYEEIHTAKIEALDSIIEEAAGAPVLVAFNFRSDVDRLKRAFPQGRDFDTDPRTIKEWNAGKIPILFVHPASAGHGLSLQDGGNIIAFFGLNWNLEEHIQVIERIGPTRQMQSGHNRPVFVHYIVAKDTIDELVLERLQTKRSVQDILLEAMKKAG